MSPLIVEGKYKIMSVKYPEYGADLHNGNPTGPVTAYPDNVDDGAQKHREWRVINVGSHGNQIILESVATPGSFPNVKDYASGVELTATTSEGVIWTVNQLAHGDFQLLTPGGTYAWTMSAGEKFAPILIEPTDASNVSQQWTFKPVSA